MTTQFTVSMHREIWQKAKEELAKKFSADIFESWFAGLSYLDGDDDNLILGTDTEFAAIWIRDNYLDIISNQVSLAAARKINVHINVVETDAKALVQETSKSDRPRVPSQPIEYRLPKSIIPHNTFETFVVGESNRFAHAAALAVAQNPGISYNPLFIYGSTGLGKTHLMHAIAQFVLKNRHDARIVYLSSETFVNEYVDALRENKITNFRKRYRNTDVLLIDDVQFFAGKERCQEEFFHTFNELFNSSKQIVLSCDKPINEVSDIEQRLVSRFGWGVSVDIQAPDYETRLAILQSKLADIPESVEIQPEVLDLRARKFTKNSRRMEGALNNLIGYATLLKTISLEKAQQLLADAFMQEEENQSIDIEDIQKKTADYFKIDESEMVGKRRPASIAMARQIAMYISRKLTTHSLQEIGKRFGGRDHGTVMHAIRVLDHSINHDENVRRAVEYLMKILSV